MTMKLIVEILCRNSSKLQPFLFLVSFTVNGGRGEKREIEFSRVHATNTESKMTSTMWCQSTVISWDKPNKIQWVQYRHMAMSTTPTSWQRFFPIIFLKNYVTFFNRNFSWNFFLDVSWVFFKNKRWNHRNLHFQI